MLRVFLFLLIVLFLSACTSTTYVSGETRISRTSFLTKQGATRVQVKRGDTTVTIETGASDQTAVARALVPAAAAALTK